MTQLELFRLPPEGFNHQATCIRPTSINGWVRKGNRYFIQLIPYNRAWVMVHCEDGQIRELMANRFEL